MFGFSTIQILMFLLGILVFIASFVIPEKKSKVREIDRRLEEEQIKELVNKEMKDVSMRISDVVDETISYAVEKTERSMERITNEKIMAVNEYSDTVLDEIHKNHEEVVFLYDMLSDKHKDLTEVVSEAEKTAKAVKAAKDSINSINSTEGMVQADTIRAAEFPRVNRMGENMGRFSSETDIVAIPPSTDNSPVFSPFRPEVVDMSKKAIAANVLDIPGTASLKNIPLPVDGGQVSSYVENDREIAPPAKSPTRRDSSGAKAGSGTRGRARSDISLSFSGSGEESRNNNQRILELHSKGKSNMAIARELGLGVGEVKLVIDLFK